ncbi:MAG: dethiobiotin synthase [Microbacteriaceae bacterium]|nr:dethiobiotin synthase [Microbacteriaceae bacterium]
MQSDFVPEIINIIGTDTDVGKTVAAAAIAAERINAGRKVAIYKPTQSGVKQGEIGDVEFAAALSGAAAFEGVRLDAAMAPVAAAKLENKTLPALQDHAQKIADLLQKYDTVLVEGAGGVAVDLAKPLSTGTQYQSQNQADLIALLAEIPGIKLRSIIIARSALGTLNHTLLTTEYLRSRSLAVEGVIIGSWPATCDNIAKTNLETFPELGLPVIGKIPANTGKNFVVGQDNKIHHSPSEIDGFRAGAPSWLSL